MVFKFILAIDGWDISHEIFSRWMSLDLTDDESALVQVMAWCRQATSHYLSQCWPSSMSPYDDTRPQWDKYLLWENEQFIRLLISKYLLPFIPTPPHITSYWRNNDVILPCLACQLQRDVGVFVNLGSKHVDVPTLSSCFALGTSQEFLPF